VLWRYFLHTGVCQGQEEVKCLIVIYTPEEKSRSSDTERNKGGQA
jgi:hypothetical protein